MQNQDNFQGQQAEHPTPPDAFASAIPLTHTSNDENAADGTASPPAHDLTRRQFATGVALGLGWLYTKPVIESFKARPAFAGSRQEAEMQKPAAPPPQQQAPVANESAVEEPPVAPAVDAPAVEVNPFTQASEDNLSTFAMDVDTASYTAARSYINAMELPPPESVRVEEFVNYFTYDYQTPTEDAFTINIDSAPSPFGMPGKQIVRVGIQGIPIDKEQRDDAVLTFVIDVSGSMDHPNRLPLVKESLRILVNELRDTDEVGIVVYSDDTRVVLDHTPVAERDTILKAIDALVSEGSTNVEDGLHLGYEIAGKQGIDGRINRIILCSDGVANVGATGPDAIRERIRGYTDEGIYLTTVGFGMGDFNDYLMEQLANDGNGNYGYVDTPEAAQRFFARDLVGTLQVIAKDAKIQVEFNPDVVDRYRLLGYENRGIADEDFRDESVDAGEVGAGHNVTALYEVVPVSEEGGTAFIAQVRYQDPKTGEVIEVQQPFDRSSFGTSFEDASPHFRLSVAAASFAEQLRGSHYAEQDRSMDDVLDIAEGVSAQLPNDQDVQEFVDLVRKARRLEGSSTPR